MIGIELAYPCSVIMGRALEAGLLLSVTADSVIRLVPPLIMTTEEAKEVLSILVPLIHTFLEEKEREMSEDAKGKSLAKAHA